MKLVSRQTCALFVVLLAATLAFAATYVKPNNANYELRDSSGTKVGTALVDITQNIIDFSYDQGGSVTQVLDPGAGTPQYINQPGQNHVYRYSKITGSGHPNCYNWTKLVNPPGAILATGSIHDHSSIEPGG